MKKNTRLSLAALCYLYVALIFAPALYAQDKPPLEFVTESSTVSFVKDTPFNIALSALSEISGRLLKKVIVDPAQRTTPIGVNIKNAPWRSALELIAARNGATILETESYILITNEAAPANVQFQTSTAVQQASGLQPVSAALREIKISATFIETDRSTLREIGINWGVFSNKGNTIAFAEQNVVGPPGQGDIGIASITRTTSTSDINILIKAFESSNVGEILANPSITVIDGREGRVQIGQDFSIKQRDFAGNVTDEFVSTGIILIVTPVIFVDDTVQYIHLDVHVERSSVIPGAVSTIINKSDADTQLLLNDGEKAVIGGLSLTEETYVRKGLPLLKNIPKWFFGLGYVFGYDLHSEIKRELIILLKAEIVPTLEERRAALLREGGE
ncbi:type II and III secretion system protein [candidate division KSB1 bacterium]|nr:type II and III secretion system protein [candidate division KSB1 bacterium]